MTLKHLSQDSIITRRGATGPAGYYITKTSRMVKKTHRCSLTLATGETQTKTWSSTTTSRGERLCTDSSSKKSWQQQLLVMLGPDKLWSCWYQPKTVQALWMLCWFLKKQDTHLPRDAELHIEGFGLEEQNFHPLNTCSEKLCLSSTYAGKS